MQYANIFAEVPLLQCKPHCKVITHRPTVALREGHCWLCKIQSPWHSIQLECPLSLIKINHLVELILSLSKLSLVRGSDASLSVSHTAIM